MASAAKAAAGNTTNTITGGNGSGGGGGGGGAISINTSPGGSNNTVPKPKSRTLDSSDTSDYENLSSCTSGRYATLPPQTQLGGQYRDHYATTTAATASAAGVIFRPASSAAGSFGAGPPPPFGPAGGDGGPHSTLSLHRPVKRSHWLNQNGRPSDVLARVFQANQDWLDSNDPQDGGNLMSSGANAALATIKDRGSTHRTRYSCRLGSSADFSLFLA